MRILIQKGRQKNNETLNVDIVVIRFSPIGISAVFWCRFGCSRDAQKEEMMIEKRFDRPVIVRNNIGGVPQAILALEDALYFMDEWPEVRRGTIYTTARRACHGAWDGRYPLDAARKAFEGWARSAGILEDATAKPSIVSTRSGRGGLTT